MSSQGATSFIARARKRRFLSGVILTISLTILVCAANRGLGQSGTPTAEVCTTNAQSDTLQEFAQKCTAAVGEPVPAFNCDSGTEVPETHLTGSYPNGLCDAPNVLNGECDPGSRFQVLKETNDVAIVGHCRKKGNADHQYGDIAVIQYNKKNGATCFYQALGELPAKVTAPSDGNGPDKFPWLDPAVTAGINCVRCHDNGPFIRSPYLAQLRAQPKNRLPGTNAGAGPWDQRFSWNKTLPLSFVGNDFQSWKTYALSITGTGGGCLACHRLAFSQSNGSYNVGAGTAQNFAGIATATAQAHKNLHSSDSPIWMTPGQITFSAANETEAKAAAACARAIVTKLNNPSAPSPPQGCQSSQFGRGNSCLGGPIQAVLDDASPPKPAGPAGTRMVLSPGKTLTFDFSSFLKGGVHAGTFQNFAFSVDLNRAEQKVSIKFGQHRKDVVATYDYADCSRNQEALLERTVTDLAPGTAAFVDHVDIEMVPTKQKDLAWRGGVCYGYRTTTGWHWNLTSTPLTYDAAAKLVRGQLWVKQPDVDALKLVFDHSVPTQSVRLVKVTTQPN
jgi:hypothetical protein